ncbi:MAG: ATP-binding protein [Pseudomonadota bacterium]|nr:ATP-binding protein [Pseudomonadota bacterium]
MNIVRLKAQDLQYRPKLQVALTDELYRRSLIPQMVFAPFLLILYLSLADAIRQRPAIGWVFVALVLVTVARVGSIIGDGRTRSRHPDPRVRMWIFTVGAMLTGTGLGIINLLSAPVVSAQEVALLACAAAGFNSISIVSMNPSLRSYFMSMLPNMGTIVVLIIIGPQMEHRNLFLVQVLVNLVALVLMAIHVHLQTRNALLLVIKMDDANEALGRANATLNAEITDRLETERILGQRNVELEALNEKLAGTQSQLLQSEKMASIGQLAAGIAHEINNPIAFVSANLISLDGYVADIVAALDAIEHSHSKHESVASNVINLRVPAKQVNPKFLREDIPALLSESIEGAARVEKIVKDLKEFSHLDEADWQKVDLHKGIDTTLNVATHELKYKVHVIRQYSSLPLVECLPFQINQVLLNLLVNAAQSIEGRGTITVSTGCSEGGVWIKIADTGKGIEPAHLKRVFEPFFTTKPVGVGTGLGLSVSYSIVRRHGGSIDVASEVGKGTIFTIHLPVAAKRAA